MKLVQWMLQLVQRGEDWADWLHRVLLALRPARCYQYGAAGPWEVVTLIAVFVDGGRRRRNVYDKKYQRKAKDNITTFNCTQ